MKTTRDSWCRPSYCRFQLKFTTSSSSHSVDEHGQDDSDSDWAEDYDEDEVLKGFDYAAYWAIFQVGYKGIDSVLLFRCSQRSVG